MADYMNYAIKERREDGTIAVIGSIASDDPKRAFLSSLVMVKQCYAKAGVEQPMFDCDPRFYAEPIGEPLSYDGEIQQCAQ